MMARGNLGRWLTGLAIAAGVFVVLGTVSALWENPLFIRMTPAGSWEVFFLALQSVLLGVFFGARPAACPAKTAAAGGVLGFLGIACPVCNQVLVLIFGGELLLTYFEPIRIWVAFAGVVVTALAVLMMVRLRRDLSAVAEPT